MAVETGLYDLYEIVDGQLSLTGPSKKLTGKKRKPVIEYFKTQSRFRALNTEQIEEVQKQIDDKWKAYSIDS